MAELRLALVALAMCTRAEAAAEPAPNGWPMIGEHVWGDTARGCYATEIEAKGAANEEQLVVALGMQGVAASDVVIDDAGVAFSFVRPPYRGRLHGERREGAIAARACFWNDREPAACEARCKAWLP